MKPFKLGAAGLAAAALVAAGCGGGDDKTTAPAKATPNHESAMTHETGTTAGAKGAVDSGAATLRANLTAALQEHVYLAGIAVANGVGKGLDSKEFKSAAATLDQNSVAVSEAIGSVYGAAAGKAFLKTWRDHVGYFVDYTKGKATKNAGLVKEAQANLAAYAKGSGIFLHKANPNLPAAAVEADFNGHIATLEKAIDSVVAGKPDAFDLLKAAAAHMPGTADVLAGAIAKQYPDKFPA